MTNATSISTLKKTGEVTFLLLSVGGSWPGPVYTQIPGLALQEGSGFRGPPGGASVGVSLDIGNSVSC